MQLLKNKISILPDKNIVKFAVTGITGGGKSELVKKYARDFCVACEEKGIAPLIWLFDAGTDEDLFLGWQKLAEGIGSKPKQGREQKDAFRSRITQDIITYLAKNPGWLLIFDDAQSAAQIKPYIPQGQSYRGTILVSSQNTHFFSASEKDELSISQGLKPAEAIALVYTICPALVNESKEDIITFVTVLGCLPLAVSVSAYDISEIIALEERLGQVPTTVRKYIDDYIVTEDEEKRMFNENKLEDFVARNNYIAKTQEKAVSTSLSKVKKDYRELLNCCAWINGNNISPILLEEFISVGKISSAQSINPHNRFIELLRAQHNRSLLQLSTLKGGVGHLFMHQVTQTQIRKQLTIEGAANISIEIAAKSLFDLMCSKMVKPKSSNDFRPWITHAESVTNYAFRLKIKTESLVMLWKKIGAFYVFALKDYEIAISCFNKAIQLAENLDKDKLAPAVGAIKNYFGYAYYLKGNLELAESYANEANQNDEKESSNEQYKENKGFSLWLMGLIYLKRAKYELAKKNYEHAYKIISSMDKNHDTLRILVSTLIGIGDVHYEQGSYQESEKKYQEALADVKNNYDGKEFVTEATIYHKLGAVNFKLKNFEAAIGYYKQALEPRERAWGPKHPLVEESRQALQKAEQALDNPVKQLVFVSFLLPQAQMAQNGVTTGNIKENATSISVTINVRNGKA